MIILNIYSHKKYTASIESWVSFEKVYRVIEFNNNAWVKPCSDMISKLRQKAAKNSCEKNVKLHISK